MKKYFSIIAAIFTLVVITSCTDEGMEFDAFEGKGLAFVHFVKGSETMSVELEEVETALHSAEIFIASTVKSDAARTYTLTVTSSSTPAAVEGTHFTLSSKTITIPAGQHSGSVMITVISENLQKDPVTAVLSINSDEAISWGKSLSVPMNRYDLCDFNPSMLVGKFDYASEDWAEWGSLTLEADPDDPYKIYILGIPTELDEGEPEWNGNKIELTIQPWVEGAGMTELSLSGPKTIVSDETWGYDDLAFEAVSGSYSICQGTYTINFRISVAQGSWGVFEFIFSK